MLRIRAKGWAIGQCAIAAGAAWFVAHDLLGHQTPFFAPIAAVVSLGTTYGQRLRRVGEVTLGVALGVFMGDVFTHVFGSGVWQISLIVAMGMVTALLLDAGPIFVTQAAVQGIVVSTLLPTSGALFLRWSDALVGGTVALVAAAVVPRAPLRRPHQQAALVVRRIGELLRTAAECIRDGDVDHALGVLRDARATDTLITELRAAADEGLSVLASSPFRRRHAGRVRQMAELVDPLDLAIRNTRVLVRRVAVASFRHTPISGAYARMIEDLADLVDRVAVEIAAGRMAEAVADDLIKFGIESSRAERSGELSAEVVLAQVRSLVADLLAICGFDPLEATDLIPPMKAPERG